MSIACKQKERIAHIYKITNLVNGKCYIGQTISKLKSRKSDHFNRCDSPKLANAIKKYGKEKFVFEAILCTKDMSVLDVMEIEMIKQYNSIKCGYNISIGGNGRGSVSEETKDKIRKKHIGKKLSEKTRKKLSEYRKELFKDKKNHPFFGKKMPEKAREALLARNEKIKKPVFQFSLSGILIKEYSSACEAANINLYEREAIARCCKGKQKTSYGYIWRYKICQEH